MREELGKVRHYQWLEEILQWVKENKCVPRGTKISSRLLQLRKARKFKKFKTVVWYPEYEALLQKYDMERLFTIPLLYNRYMSFEKLLLWVKEHGRTPNQNGTLPNERFFGLKLSGLRSVKLGTNKHLKWYPEYDNILKEYNMEWLFNVKSTEEKVIELAKYIKKHGQITDVESQEYQLLCNLKSSMKGRSSLVWKPRYAEIFDEHGLMKLLKPTRRIKSQGLSIVTVTNWLEKNGKPSRTGRTKKERQVSRRLEKFRYARRGSERYTWTPEYEKLVKEKQLEKYFE